ncbi:MAG: prepilin-type N-terminal cleavage/methylation domain-containing protein [Calditrichia bacterium]
MKLASNQKGFTMIELIVVIIILGVLAAIAVPKYFSMSSQAEEAACRANMKAIEAAYVMDYSQQILNAGSYTAPGAIPADFFTSGHVPVCPSDGEYTVTTSTEDGDFAVQVSCSVHGNPDGTPPAGN